MYKRRKNALFFPRKPWLNLIPDIFLLSTAHLPYFKNLFVGIIYRAHFWNYYVYPLTPPLLSHHLETRKIVVRSWKHFLGETPNLSVDGKSSRELFISCHRMDFLSPSKCMQKSFFFSILLPFLHWPVASLRIVAAMLSPPRLSPFCFPQVMRGNMWLEKKCKVK